MTSKVGSDFLSSVTIAYYAVWSSADITFNVNDNFICTLYFVSNSGNIYVTGENYIPASVYNKLVAKCNLLSKVCFFEETTSWYIFDENNRNIFVQNNVSRTRLHQNTGRALITFKEMQDEIIIEESRLRGKYMVKCGRGFSDNEILMPINIVYNKRCPVDFNGQKLNNVIQNEL